LIDALHAVPPVDPGHPVLVPGDPENDSRTRRLQDGIPVPATLAVLINAICGRAAVPYLLG
jgi:LDH2 family malate/lactate/ureidoglycolate dehydrogenase